MQWVVKDAFSLESTPDSRQESSFTFKVLCEELHAYLHNQTPHAGPSRDSQLGHAG